MNPKLESSADSRTDSHVGSGDRFGFGKHRVRVTRLTIVPDGEPIFSEQATHVEIEDEAAGEFVKLTQQIANTADADMRTIRIDPQEWPAIRHAIEQLLPNNELSRRPTGGGATKEN